MGKYSGKTCRLLTMLGMTASFFLVEIIVGYVTNSIALVADSFHMLSDVVALIVGFASVRVSNFMCSLFTWKACDCQTSDHVHYIYDRFKIKWQNSCTYFCIRSIVNLRKMDVQILKFVYNVYRLLVQTLSNWLLYVLCWARALCWEFFFMPNIGIYKWHECS